MSRFEYRAILCPICDADDTESVGRRGGEAHRAGLGEVCNIVRCRRCTLLYPNPFPFPRDLDALYSDSEGYFEHHADQATKSAGQDGRIVEIEGLTTGRRLLDVGAGRGETVAAALRRGWDAHGVETSAAFVAEANAICGGRVFHGTLDEAPAAISGAPFDVIVLDQVLEHLHEPSAVMASIARALAPDGILYVDVPNEAAPYFMAGNAYHRLQGRDWVVNLAPTFSPFHVFGYGKVSLTKLLHKHGLEAVDWQFYPGNAILPPPRSLRGAVEWLAGRAVHSLSRVGELGTYMSCYARKRRPGARLRPESDAVRYMRAG